MMVMCTQSLMPVRRPQAGYTYDPDLSTSLDLIAGRTEDRPSLVQSVPLALNQGRYL